MEGNCMAHSSELELLTLAGVAHRCAQETHRFFQRQGHDPRFCFELFRRAIVERSQQAWGLIYAQYRPLVAGWVERHSAFASSGEEVQYFVNRAFEKMWAALTPVKFHRFPDLKSLLRYLQMCVHSTILDTVRRSEVPVVDLEVAESVVASNRSAPDAGETALDRIHGQEIWSLVSARLKDEKERKAVYGSFVLALKPRELQAQYPDIFRDVKEVYRAKENVLARLGRDAELRSMLRVDG
jgi:DNA-directed RNA polymerase specialized sigma24 family protein